MRGKLHAYGFSLDPGMKVLPKRKYGSWAEVHQPEGAEGSAPNSDDDPDGPDELEPPQRARVEDDFDLDADEHGIEL